MSNKLSQQVYDYLKQELVRGNLLPGEALNLNEISETLNISKSPLRDALIRLETEGILTIFPRSKVVLNKLDIDDITYLFKIIGSLESTLVTKSLDLYTPDVIDNMYALNEQMRIALKENYITLYDEAHRKFHDVFLIMSPSKFVERILSPIKCRLWDLPKKNFPLEWMQLACNEHHNIIQAIEEKNIENIIFELEKRHWDFHYNQTYIQRTYFN